MFKKNINLFELVKFYIVIKQIMKINHTSTSTCYKKIYTPTDIQIFLEEEYLINQQKHLKFIEQLVNINKQHRILGKENVIHKNKLCHILEIVNIHFKVRIINDKI